MKEQNKKAPILCSYNLFLNLKLNALRLKRLFVNKYKYLSIKINANV